MEGITFKLNQSFTHQNPRSDITVWRANSAYTDLLGLCDLSAVTVVLSTREDHSCRYTDDSRTFNLKDYLGNKSFLFLKMYTNLHLSTVEILCQIAEYRKEWVEYFLACQKNVSSYWNSWEKGKMTTYRLFLYKA